MFFFTFQVRLQKPGCYRVYYHIEKYMDSTHKPNYSTTNNLLETRMKAGWCLYYVVVHKPLQRYLIWHFFIIKKDTQITITKEILSVILYGIVLYYVIILYYIK